MPTKGSAYRAEQNPTLRATCAHCGKSIPTEVGHAHPLHEPARDLGTRRTLRRTKDGVPDVLRLS